MSEPAEQNDPPLPALPPRNVDSHKGSFGRALLVGGSRGMSGAIRLSGLAALRSGAGLVQLAVPEPLLPVVAAAEPSYMTAPLPVDPQVRIAGGAREPLVELSRPATAVGIGPGLGHSQGLIGLVEWLYGNLDRPLVVDADALNALAELEKLPQMTSGQRILTPHPGEFARLTRRDTSAVQGDRQNLASQFAADNGVVVVLKGYETVITDGQQTAINRTGNPGLATGGTGDVLTGIITALLAQGMSPFDAARLGAHVHGLAGDLAALELGPMSMIASDLIRFLPAAFQQLAAT